MVNPWPRTTSTIVQTVFGVIPLGSSPGVNFSGQPLHFHLKIRAGDHDVAVVGLRDEGEGAAYQNPKAQKQPDD